MIAMMTNTDPTAAVASVAIKKIGTVLCLRECLVFWVLLS